MWLLQLLALVLGASAESCDHELVKVSMLQTQLSLARRSLNTSSPPRDQVYNVHIPKSAGSSFAFDAMHVLSPKYKLISQEGCLALHSSNERLKASMTMLREPRQHVLSQYKMCRSQWVEAYRQAMRSRGDHVLPHRFENWVDAWERLAEESWHGDFTPEANLSGAEIEEQIRSARVAAWGEPPYSVEKGTKLRLEDWVNLDGGGTVWHFTRVPFQCYSPMDLQSHRLTCQRPLKYEAEINKELLIENVKSLWFVGFAEAYQSSICLLHWRVHESLPSFCDCADASKWESFQGHTENQNSSYHGEAKLTQLSRKTLKQIDALTATDRFLYHFSWRRFVRECEEVYRRSGRRILCNATAA